MSAAVHRAVKRSEGAGRREPDDAGPCEPLGCLDEDTTPGDKGARRERSTEPLIRQL